MRKYYVTIDPDNMVEFQQRARDLAGYIYGGDIGANIIKLNKEQKAALRKVGFNNFGAAATIRGNAKISLKAYKM